MRKKIEVLEDIANVDALAQDLFLLQLIESVFLPAVADVIPIDLDKAFIYPLQMINSPQQGVRLKNGKYPTLRLFFIQNEVQCLSSLPLKIYCLCVSTRLLSMVRLLPNLPPFIRAFQYFPLFGLSYG